MGKYLFFGCFVLLMVQGVLGRTPERPYVIMVSFDGFRHDYVEKYDLPHFKEFIRAGAQAERLIPSFPSKTFPNHYTLVTGLYPGHHGLVSNRFYAPELHRTYSISNRETVCDPAFYGGTPLWQLAQQQGVPTASFFWVGSEAPILGEFPDRYLMYDASIPNASRIDTVQRWLQLPEAERPHFITLYFSLVDDAGHAYGPNSDEVRAAVREADTLVEQLMKMVHQTDLPINVILTSDHGMLEMETKPETYLFLPELVDVSDTTVVTVNNGTQVSFYTDDPARRDALYQRLKTQETHFRVYRQSDFPKRWHFQNPRAGDVLLVADSGYYVVGVGQEEFGKKVEWGTHWGTHGFDPQTVQAVSGIFYAWGPQVQPGVIVPAFENVHVYPFVAELLGLKTPRIDGRKKVLHRLYRRSARP
ncbi:alkaline phosphatase D [Catalinimonas alkaloidigena]|uniref:Alkaline phosphatase D n=1 Tax=Catalinimonas alkaloidigena TaxID=1075417 RepID=A0A1G9NGL1_9BACT|nr:ectonucleotide pyrophosphatase/phosphodiesterase [Catalinimonas alkaloidigena]SDL85504.1 alkaline phosphatase D [Catalinimonas alkaloidigena]